MSDGPTSQAETNTPEPRSRLRSAVLDSPLTGISPWIVMSLFSGPGRFEASVLAAMALSLVIFVLGRRRGSSVKLLEIFDLLFFVGFAVIGILASPATITWMEQWAGEITNIALTIYVLVTIAIRRPFTLGYAKESTEPRLWDSPGFLRINYQISLTWGAVFGFQTMVGLYGDAIQHTSDNFWTQRGAGLFSCWQPYSVLPSPSSGLTTPTARLTANRYRPSAPCSNGCRSS